MQETMEAPIISIDRETVQNKNSQPNTPTDSYPEDNKTNEAYTTINEPNGQPQRAPTQKEIAQYEKEQKMIRKNNREFLDDAEMRLRNAQINTEFIETNVRAMKAFMESEELRDKYLSLVDKKKIRDEQDSKINDSK